MLSRCQAPTPHPTPCMVSGVGSSVLFAGCRVKVAEGVGCRARVEAEARCALEVLRPPPSTPHTGSCTLHPTHYGDGQIGLGEKSECENKCKWLRGGVPQADAHLVETSET